MAAQDERKYIVYPKDNRRPHGPEVVCAYVEIVGKQAFVRRKKDSTRAEVVSASTVFPTKEAAQSYIADGGMKMWVVCEITRNGFEVPTMFQARVLHYTYIGRYYPERNMSVKRLSDGQDVKVVSFRNLSVHDTKDKAEKAFVQLWNATRNELTKRRDKYNEHLELLQKEKPRSRKASSARKKP